MSGVNGGSHLGSKPWICVDNYGHGILIEELRHVLHFGVKMLIFLWWHIGFCKAHQSTQKSTYAIWSKFWINLYWTCLPPTIAIQTVLIWKMS